MFPFHWFRRTARPRETPRRRFRPTRPRTLSASISRCVLSLSARRSLSVSDRLREPLRRVWERRHERSRDLSHNRSGGRGALLCGSSGRAFPIVRGWVAFPESGIPIGIGCAETVLKLMPTNAKQPFRDGTAVAINMSVVSGLPCRTPARGHVLAQRGAEYPPPLLAEPGRALVADAERDLGCVEPLAPHQSPSPGGATAAPGAPPDATPTGKSGVVPVHRIDYKRTQWWSRKAIATPTWNRANRRRRGGHRSLNPIASPSLEFR